MKKAAWLVLTVAIAAGAASGGVAILQWDGTHYWLLEYSQ